VAIVALCNKVVQAIVNGVGRVVSTKVFARLDKFTMTGHAQIAVHGSWYAKATANGVLAGVVLLKVPALRVKRKTLAVAVIAELCSKHALEVANGVEVLA